MLWCATPQTSPGCHRKACICRLICATGEISYRMVGTHRRIRFEDLREHRRRDDLKHRQAADELTQLSEELGLY